MKKFFTILTSGALALSLTAITASARMMEDGSMSVNKTGRPDQCSRYTGEDKSACLRQVQKVHQALLDAMKSRKAGGKAEMRMQKKEGSMLRQLNKRTLQEQQRMKEAKYRAKQLKSSSRSARSSSSSSVSSAS